MGQYKVDAAAARIKDIDPTIEVRTYKIFYTPETADQFDFTRYDYVVDAIDTVTGKLALVERARQAGVPILSCMGAGNKLDAAAFEVADIGKTAMCPLARIMRKELRKRGITHLKVVYSQEEALEPLEEIETEGQRRPVPGSVAFVPGAAGLIAAGEVIKDLTASARAAARREEKP